MNRVIIKGKKVKVPIYNFTFKVFVVSDFSKVCEPVNFPEGYEYDGGVFFHEDKPPELVVVQDCPAHIVVHEIMHLLTHILEQYGLRVDPENDESIAYLAEYLFRECWEFINSSS